ncbi:uncharacterized protein LOC126816076 [Patella vulgata]|uniref:uncharacterized protein LOC126816076 n=1 Tax=Patella vulgata TaxID=6465 RepID=UPI00217F9FCF|nr:uncharacterized protein LOC126816076 [Patella vulgata]XP_050398222.1 uncharacterized protein LOC126816076 [Patella vulgata]
MEHDLTENREVQTSLPSSIKTIPTGIADASSISDITTKSDLSSECLSVTKLDSLYTNSMKILVRRSNTIVDHDTTNRISAVEGIRRPPDDDTPCTLECCRLKPGTMAASGSSLACNQTVYEAALSNLHGRSATWLPDNSTASRPHLLLKSTRNDCQGKQSTLRGGLIGVSVDQNRTYRPQTISATKTPSLGRSRTTLSSGARHCDACSVKDLQEWFKTHPSSIGRSPRGQSDLTHLMIGREKSQVFLVNKPLLDTTDSNTKEVLLPMTTVPKKGLIKLTCVAEESLQEKQKHTGKQCRREPIRYLIRNKDVLKAIKSSFNRLHEHKSSIDQPLNDCNKLTTQDLRRHVLDDKTLHNCL